ncbi:glycosyltransferase, partial [bacterium]|nr:glycosyltransferase [bacterium]
DFLLSKRIDGAKLKLPPVEHQFRLLRSLGIQDGSKKLQLFPTELEKQNVDNILKNQWLGNKQILVGMNIGSSTQWETKRWPTENLIKLCRKFHQKGARVLITGSKQDVSIAKKLISSVKSKPINMVGKTTLMELACLIKRCKLFITGDSAPLHIAVAMSTPCIALFGPTDPERHLQPTQSIVVIQKKLKCSPCYRRVCHNVKCMKKISVEEVFGTAMRMLGMNETGTRSSFNNMNILLITTRLNLGGIGVYASSLARGLKKKGHKVIVASSGGELENVLSNSGIKHIYLPIDTSSEVGPHIMMAVMRLLKVIRKENIQIVHGQTRVSQVIGHYLEKFSKAVFVTTCHGFF